MGGQFNAESGPEKYLYNIINKNFTKYSLPAQIKQLLISLNACFLFSFIHYMYVLKYSSQINVRLQVIGFQKC